MRPRKLAHQLLINLGIVKLPAPTGRGADIRQVFAAGNIPVNLQTKEGLT